MGHRTHRSSNGGKEEERWCIPPPDEGVVNGVEAHSCIVSLGVTGSCSRTCTAAMQTADCVFVVALDFSICFHLCFKVCSSCCPIGCELGSGENDIFVFVGGGFSGPYLFTPREVHGRERQLGDVRGLSLDATWGVLVK
ncbi:uncharacterized protein [Physcomitrium patens]|uniref:Uncharacterized protein n=1 Tax=Physcomitrium patens TaxID=3218 RepID=A0A2K1KGR0_PHYPA|nr:uncharacterized protein LOC112283389 [Physcomitrium patens]PNR52949.1 hypothetical protein PHYPA_009324 [Physcomitrium patens]|eukprot:XP_024377777.1 uncharacterized protein LOC112283389 [Physcomitrella patens]